MEPLTLTQQPRHSEHPDLSTLELALTLGLLHPASFPWDLTMPPPHRFEAQNASSSERRYRRKLQRRRRALAGSKLIISNQPILRTLKPSARKQLGKTRAPKLWILPTDINFRSTTCHKQYPRASILALPPELRQHILFISYDFRRVEGATLQLPRKKPSQKPSMAAQGNLTDDEYHIISMVNHRITQLCKVSKVMSEDMQYVGGRWQHAVLASIHERFRTSSLEFSAFNIQSSSYYGGNQRRGLVIQGDNRSLTGRRPGKCWYCTERHMSGRAACPRATADPQAWLQETRAIGSWRCRKGPEGTLKATKVIFSD